MLANRVAIITGASQGLGAHIAESYVKASASVALCSRNKEGLEEIKTKLTPLLTEGQKIFVQTCNVSETKQVDAFFDEVLTKFPNADILVNNAGIYGPIGPTEDIAWDEWVHAININLFGAIYSCKLFIKHLKKLGYGKIINISGGGATSPMPRITSYAVSKAAIVRFSESIAMDLKTYNIDVNCIAPGALDTELNRKLLKQDPSIIGQDFHDSLKRQLEDGGVPLSIPASLAVYLASHESDGITGKLISAKWDNWKDLAKHKKALSGSDIYTLRRIVPEDRNQKW